MFGLVDLGGTKVLAATARAVAGPLRASRRIPTPDASPIEVLVRLLEEVADGSPLAAVALALPGPFDRSEGRLLLPPGMPPVWHGLRIRSELSDRLQCPVIVENDANCAALAEASTGAGAGEGTVVYVTVSTDIGMGVVDHGRLVVGRRDIEPGHQVLWPAWLGGPACGCGGHGCLATLASGRAIERRFGVAPADLDDQDAWDDVGRWLGLGIANVITMHDPDVIVIGGGVTRRAGRFWPSMLATVEASVHLQPVPRITPAALGEDRTLLGALTLLQSTQTG